jgi:hypothetical protein
VAGAFSMRWAGGQSGGVAGSRRTRGASFAGGGGDEGRRIRARNRRVIDRFLGSVLRALVVDDAYDALVGAGETGSPWVRRVARSIQTVAWPDSQNKGTLKC